MTLYLFVQLFLATVMIASALFKVFSLKSFNTTMREIGVSIGDGMYGSMFVILLELVAGISLLMVPYKLIGASLVLLLTFGYAWAVWKAKRAATKINCNCFGELLPDTLGKSTVIRIIMVFSCCLVVFLSPTFLHHIAFIELLSAICISLGIIGMYALVKALASITSSHREVGGYK